MRPTPFRRENEFEDTPIGLIPRDWKIKKVSEIFEVETGTTPSTREREYWDNGNVKWITPTDLSELDGNTHISDTGRKVTEKAISDNGLTLLPPGSIILSTRAPVGYVAILDDYATFNQGCKGLVAYDRNSIFSDFYCYYLSNIKNVLEGISGGSTFKELSKDSLESLNIPLPPFTEQQKISWVLSIVDLAHERTKKILSKLQDLKQSLIQYLMTTGIGHTEFKETRMGRVPKAWDIVNLGSVADFKNGINFNKSQKDGSGILTLDVLNMYTRPIYLDLSNLYRVNVSPKDDYILQKGDILFVRSSLKREGVGWASMFNGYEEPVTFSGFIIRARLNAKSLMPEFLTYFLRSRVIRNEMIASGGQVAITNITQDLLRGLKVPIPSIDEQKQILSILLAIDEKLGIEAKTEMYLKTVKKFLMDMLLTGKIRIKGD